MRTLIFTGDGKGKTTAAFGTALRAAGHGQRVLIVQFLKSNAATGELLAMQRLPEVRVAQMGRGFVPAPAHPDFESHRAAANEALAFSKNAVASHEYDLIVLDEICGAIAHGLISEDDVLALLAHPDRAPGGKEETCIVLTGRNASPRLMAAADTVTEMRCVRHGFQNGIAAQKGVEY